MSHDPGTSQLDAVLINNTMNAGRDINLNVSVNDLSIPTRLKASLNPVSSASYNSYEAKQRSECFPNTRVQVLNEIEAWITGGSQQAPIYILDGVAGIGKSTIAQTIAVKAAKMGLLGASFFFSRDEDLRKITKHFFPTIAFQLGCYNDTLAAHISASLDKNPDAPTQRLNQQFLLLLLEPLRDFLLQRGRPILIVVDALDECENDDAHNLLSLLGQYTPMIAGLKMLITTRPEWHLRQVLDQDSNHERFRLHDIEKSIVQSDIHLYLHARLSPEEIRRIFPNRRTLWQPSAHDMSMLCGICGTLFIIAATASKFILHPQHVPQKQLSLLLKGVSPDDFTGSKHTNVLDETYLRIICATQSDLDEFEEDWFRELNKILGALITLANPLSCDALASLLDIDADELEATLSNLHSLVAPTGNRDNMIFRIHHKSFPDFITNRERIQRVLKSWKMMTQPKMDSLLWIDVNSHHLQLAKACLRAMNDGLKWNMADIKEVDWYKDKKDIPHVLPSLIPRDLAYASLHWATHLLGSQKRGFDVVIYDYLDRWSSVHILHWIEVMAILNQVDKMSTILQDAITSIRLITAEAWSQRSRVEELISDCSRFVLQASAVMSLSPMHIYRSCLPFIPPETSLYDAYRAVALLQMGMERNARWDPLLMTCVGHSDHVLSVAFSSDGSYFASGARDEKIRLWDAKSGAHIQTLTGHDSPVFSIVFSNDSSRLLCGSLDNAARLWEVKTGRPLITLIGHSEPVLSVAFSSDGSLLGSGSDDTTIRLWDAATGTCIATLNGHSDHVTAVAFSKDGLRLVSGSRDKTIKIWDITTCARLLTLTGHSGDVNSAVFSNDGSQVASGSNDKTVRLWDAKIGTQIYEFVGHSDRVYSVAFSSDDSTLASGSGDYTILLWDAKSGAHISTLSGHAREVYSVVFSNDGSRLASGSYDNTVRLWDTSTCMNQLPQSTPAGHSAWVKSIAFSEDGSRLASASGDKTLRLWDVRTGMHISVLADSIYGGSPVAFLSDSSRLAFGCDDNTIQILDAENGTHNMTLTGHDDRVMSVSFSKDGAQLASGSMDKTIRTWDEITGAHLATLTGHSDFVWSLAFSNDGSRLASGSNDYTVRIWDTATSALIHTLTGHTNIVTSVAFSNDDSLLASTQYGGSTIYIWDVVMGALQSTVDGAAFSLSELISFVFLTCNGRTGPKNHMSLLLLVKKEDPRVTGLAKASIRSWNGWEIEPLCWFPPDMEGRELAFNQAQCRAAVGCRDGRVVVIDFSSERSQLYSFNSMRQ